jgi:hypothetical protein
MLLLSLIPGGPKLSAVMYLAGCRSEEVTVPAPKKGHAALYMRCSRCRQKIKQANTALNAQQAPQVPAPPVPPAPTTLALPILNVRAPSMYTGKVLVSPLSALDTSSGPPLAWSSGSSSASTLAKLPSQPPDNASISSITTSGTTHKTSKGKQHQQCTWWQVKIDLDTIAYKVGTLLYNTVLKNKNILVKFKTPNGCAAAAVNQMFGIELVSGRPIINGVKEDQAGKSPPHHGLPRRIPDDEFKDLAILMYTISAIEQFNSDPHRLDGMNLISLCGPIVNEKIIDKGRTELNEIHFNERIQQLNSRMQDLEVIDSRDALRVRWLTFSNLRNNYIFIGKKHA